MTSALAAILTGLALVAAAPPQEARDPLLSLTPVAPPVVLPPAPRPTMVYPVWVRRPAPDYPETAFDAGIARARVRLECDVAVDGTIPHCDVIDETHEGYGFGEAAREATLEGIVEPWVQDGVAIEARAWVTIEFVLEEDEPEETTERD